MDEAGLLDLIYDAALAPERWVTALEGLADLVRGNAANLTRFDLLTGVGPVIAARSDPANFAVYLKDFAHQNPLNNVADTGAYARGWRPRILADPEWMPREDFERTAYYNDFLRPLDRDAILMVRLALANNEVSVINIFRSQAAGSFGSVDIDLAGRLHGHLIRAFELCRKLEARRTLDDGLASVFEASPHAFFLLDARGRILTANAAAETLLRRDSGLSSRDGRINAISAKDARRLEGLIARAGHPDRDLRCAGSLTLQTASRATPLSMVLMPVTGRGQAMFETAPAVIACVSDLETGLSPSAARLHDLFHLTPAEARLALALLAGDTVREAAERLSISVNTASVHLARIFDKTGVNRQSALIRLLMRAADPIAQA